MSEYINKNGLEVGTSPKEVFDEVMRGTGFVIGPNCSFFIENAGLHDKNIVVSKGGNSKNFTKTKKFPSSQFQDAFDLFTSWSEKG